MAVANCEREIAALNVAIEALAETFRSNVVKNASSLFTPGTGRDEFWLAM